MSREMKYSGVPWIGEIPKGWSTIPFKAVVTNVTTGLNPRDNFELSKDAELYYVTIRNFKDGKLYLDENCDRIDRRAWEIIQNRSDLRKGDILFASISKDAQCYILDNYPHTWNINESVFALRGDYSIIYDKYLYYSLINPEYYNDLRLDATGTTFQSIKQKKLKDSTLVLPIYEEQQKIASFLDRKCTEVDEMIALQEQIIEELKAYKQSVITEAVTKGLNPDVPMRDSGIEWIGQIPEHWEIAKLSILFSFKGGYAFDSSDFRLDGTNQVVRIGNVKNDSLLLDASPVYISNEIAFKAQKFKLEKGQILFTMTGTKGKRDYFYTLLLKDNHFSDKELYLNQRVGCFIGKDRVYTEYYNYLLKDKHILDAIFLYETGTANQGNLGIESIKQTKVQFPPLAEQQAIADYLDKKCADIDSLIQTKQSKIDSLKEYKKSIIYEYVTGKREVE